MDPSSKPNPEDQNTSAIDPNNHTARPVTIDESDKPSESLASAGRANTPQASDTTTTPPDTASDEPTATQPVVGNLPKRRKLFSKPVLMGVGLTLLVVAGAAAGYFGYIVPNKPENVWNAALLNTGKIYDTLTEFATKPQEAETTGSIIDGSYKIKGDLVSDGTFSGKSDGVNSESKMNISASGLKLVLDIRTIESSTGSPDLYVKADGLKGVGALLGGGNPYFAEAFDKINNQWYFIDHTLFDQMNNDSPTDTNITEQDVKAFMDAIGKPSKEYLFTDDAEKAVFVLKQTLPAETRDGRDVYHYKVGLNKTHFKTYLNTLCGKIKQDKVGKLLLQAGSASGQSCENFAERADNIDKDDTADVWVDRHTKLVHAVRFSDKQDKNNFLELNQDYQGGSKYPFGIILGDSSGSAPMTLALKGNIDGGTQVLTLKGDLSSKDDKGTTGTFNLTVKPNPDKNLKVTKPADAKSFAELLNDIGLGALLGSGSFEDVSGLDTVPTLSL